MTGKILSDERLNVMRRHCAWSFDLAGEEMKELFGHLDAIANKLRESEAGAAALREALDKFGHTSSCQDDADVGISECCGAGIASCETTAGRDLLERLRKVEAELTQAIEDRSNAVEIAHTEQGNTIRAERERDAAIKRAEAAEARVKELEALASSACAHAMNANLSWSKSDDLSVRLRAALEKCVEALGVATTPLARDRLTVLDALRAASDARAEI